MITPNDNFPIDGAMDTEPDEQRSQQEVHGNGLGDEFVSHDDDPTPETELLEQAMDAAEPSYTLGEENGIIPLQQKENTNIKAQDDPDEVS
jgi:hypothetical protein